ncbi:MAG TPA: HAMP domain-containing sensor histidine kinase [Candidatus Limnocylindria bacterium]|nr:HAMP domain-containing sensor histidine kinase [Candidatus Limnocylindria bacterium]
MTRLAPDTLRARLTVGHSVIVFVSILAFAVTARMLLAQLQRKVADTRLRTAAAALDVLLAHTGPKGERADLAALAGMGVTAVIVAGDGRVLSATGNVPAVVRTALRPAQQNGSIVKVHGPGTHVRMLVFALRAGVAPHWGVVWHTVDTGADVDMRATLVFVIVIPVIVAFAFVAGDALTRRSLRPLYAITAMATTIEATDLSRRIAPIPGTSELADLCATLNRMFARLESAFQRQRQFTADASHELRTPLSVIMAEADLAADGLGDDEEYRQAMRVILREAHTVEALTSELLALAREESGLPRPVGPIDVSAAAASAVERLEGLARSRAITVRSRASRPATILGDRDAVERIPISLLHNALKFSDAGGTIDVTVEAGCDVVRLVIEDEGPGLSPEGLEHAFDRFWRGDLARRGEGSGLGLAIVKSLVEGARGTIEIGNRPQGGCRVAVTFPLAEISRPAGV